jgi:hypothetical protein
MLGLVNLGGGSVSLTGASVLPKPHDYVPPRCGQEYQAHVPDFVRGAAVAATEFMGAGAAQPQPRWRAAFELGQRSLSVRSSLSYDDLQRGAHFALFQTLRGAPQLAATSASTARNLSDASGATAAVHGSPSAAVLASAAAARALEGLLQEYGATPRRRLLPASRGAHRFEGRGTSAGPGLEVILAAYQGCAGSVEAVRACLDVCMVFAEAPAAPVAAADYERRMTAWLGVLRAAVEFAARQRAAAAAGDPAALATSNAASAAAAAGSAAPSSSASGSLTSTSAMEADGVSPAAAPGASAAPQLLSLAPPGGRPAVSPSSASVSAGGAPSAALPQPAASTGSSVPVAGPAAAGAASSSTSASSVYRGADPREPVTSQYATAVLQAATAFCFAAAIAEARVKAAGRIGAACSEGAAAASTASAAAPSPSLSATITEAPHAAVAVLLLPHVPPPRPLPTQRVARGKESAWADAEVRAMCWTPESRATACSWSVANSVAWSDSCGPA